MNHNEAPEKYKEYEGEYLVSEFVQVEQVLIHPSGEPSRIWRNALYTGLHGSSHSVIFADGSKQAISHQQKIRKAKIN